VSRPSFLLRKAAQLIVGRWRKRDARRALRAAGSTVRIHWTREWGWTKLKQPTVRRQWALLACPPPNPSAGPGPEAGAPKPRQARCVRVHGCLPGFSIAAGSIKRASQSTPSPLSPEPPSPSSSLRASDGGHQRRFFFPRIGKSPAIGSLPRRNADPRQVASSGGGSCLEDPVAVRSPSPLRH